MNDEPNKQLYMCRERGDDGEWLSFNPDAYQISRPAKPEETTLEALADLLDEDAENINAHDYVTCHRALAAMLYQEMGREQATRIMRRLADFEGLHGLIGVAGGTDADAHEELLGVPLNNWKDWKLG